MVLTARLPRAKGSVIVRTPLLKTALAPTVVSALIAFTRSWTVEVAVAAAKPVVPALMVSKPVTARSPLPAVSTICSCPPTSEAFKPVAAPPATVTAPAPEPTVAPVLMAVIRSCTVAVVAAAVA